MLYLIVQPYTTYFIWQLELQLRNLYSLGIQKENIQVLNAYNKELGLNPDFQKLKPGILADTELITADKSIFYSIWSILTKSLKF